jgi:flagellar assembly protein FliH
LSEIWQDIGAQAARVASLAAPPATFTAWGRVPTPAGLVPAAQELDSLGSDLDEDAIIDPAAIHDQAFAAGHAEGLAMLERAILDERVAVARLAQSLDGLRPEPAGPLAALLARTVERLVRQVVGEVAIDDARLIARATAAAELIADETAPARMCVHPADYERLAGAALPVELVADPTIAPGSVSVEGVEGWIEDGPGAALDRLGQLLDRMGVAG